MAQVEPLAAQPLSKKGHAAKVRRFAKLVTVGLIIFCNVVLLAGVWISGVNLDELMKTPDLFNSKKDICLRLTWQQVAGVAEPVRLCSEWINLADPSGQSHLLSKDIKIRQGPDGQYYFDQGIQADFRLLGLGLFVGTMLAFGMWMRRVLVNRYRSHLDMAAPRSSIYLH
jgi:hypothetical protein